jgi:hypothetical protein
VRECQESRPRNDRDDRTLAAGEKHRTSLDRWIDRRHLIFSQPEYITDIGERGFFDAENQLRGCSSDESSAKVRAHEIVDLL